jgi:molybdopterin/thiamine biosynthesis adenylyltransferase
MDEISSRHRGTLDGRFTDTRIPARVTIFMSEEVARNPNAQHLAWMLANLLARQTVEVGSIELQIPGGVPLCGRLSPLLSAGGDFTSALRLGVGQINPQVLVASAEPACRVSVGIGPVGVGEGDFTIWGSASGWSGYVGWAPSGELGKDPNPIGAYVSACLCAGEIFKFVRAMRLSAGSFARQLWVNAYGFTISATPGVTPDIPRGLQLRQAVLAGIGAVGTAFLHTLYPLEYASGRLVLIDGDVKGITRTNLNRYVLFGRRHAAESLLKASSAAIALAGSRIVAEPHDKSWEEWRAENPDARPDLVISAVDKNSARHAIQDTLPLLILGGSTNEMRAQINLNDVLNGGPCLRCRNRPESQVADEVIIERLRTLSRVERAGEAQHLGVNAEDLDLFLTDPKKHCGLIGGETLRKFASEGDDPAWSVGFVSVMAGVLLAAEYLKISAGTLEAALGAAKNTFRFQFWRPDYARVNAVTDVGPEYDCLCQTPFFRSVIEEHMEPMGLVT